MKSIDLRNAKAELPEYNSADTLFVNQDLVLIRSVKDITLTDETFFVNGFITATIRQGHATIEIDNDKFNIAVGDTFICTPRNIIESAMISVDFDMIGMVISPQFAQLITRETGLDIPAFAVTTSHKILHLTPEENEVFITYYDLLAHVCLKEHSNMRDRELYHLLQAAAIEMFDMFSQKDPETKDVSGFSAAEQTFARFVQLLHENNSPLHSVNEYADRLHITPKYFSSICKQVAGRTASDIINEEIVNSARILLRDPQNSIKMVADKLNFANQSHFGTFIRRHTGMSPQQLRETL